MKVPLSLSITHLIVVRHGETAWNRERRLQGQLDIPLNSHGEAQAERLGAALAAEPIDAVYASDLRRAAQTATSIASPLGLQVQHDASLRERCYGEFEGKTYAEVAEQHPEGYAAWQARHADFAPGGGESLQDFHGRALEAVLRLARRHPGQRIALVTHGGVLDSLYRAAHAMLLEAPRQHELLNAGINRLTSDGHTLCVAQWGEVGHLESLTLDEVDRRVP
jgi:probable phosphoglycerate mutase